MFELSIIKKYMTPKRRQLSISIISLISIFVIALVTWLLLVFFSVTNGLERTWIQKLTAVTAPVRVTPTAEYYNSYYYLIDSISADADYSLKTIGEKRESETAHLYDASQDQEPPTHWAPPLLNSDGTIKDLVKEAFAGIEEIPNIRAADYEVTGASLRLKLLRLNAEIPTQAALTQSTYVGNLESDNLQIVDTLLTNSVRDVENYYHMLGVTSDHLDEESSRFVYAPADIVQERLDQFFQTATIQAAETPPQGWRVPPSLWPTKGKLKGLALIKQGTISTLLVPHAKDKWKYPPNFKPITFSFSPDGITLQGEEKGRKDVTMIIPGGLPIQVTPDQVSVASKANEVLYNMRFTLQNVLFNGITSIGQLRITEGKLLGGSAAPRYWFHKKGDLYELPESPEFGEGILLPKTFREAGLLLGDRGYVSYYTPTASNLQEQRVPVYVAGFYDPGILPIGGKLILANRSLTSIIRASHGNDDSSVTNGINVRFKDINQAPLVKAQIEANLKERGLDRYWKVETFREYEHARDILLQLQSDKTLLTLISLIIIVVACSNIISMLVILVNDKKQEIGILRSMGASSRQIAAIFGGCGMLIGLIGSLLGMAIAILTLYRLDLLVKFLSSIQGHTAFNPLFYGDQLPNQVSLEAMGFILITTTLISLLAGLVPAMKACLLRPTEILKAE